MRYRVCQLVQCIMNALSDDAEISDVLWDTLQVTPQCLPLAPLSIYVTPYVFLLDPLTLLFNSLGLYARSHP